MHVHSWAGANLLGGGDGATLADPQAVQSKLASKTRGLRSLVGEHVVAPLHIDNVPDLGDVKVAWDHVHVEGFLGSRLTLQTTWSAYDSMLAAPLVLDLGRLLALAHAAGVSGPVPELGFFFKDPWDSDVHDAGAQAADLTAWARRTAARAHA
jgi:myo-inositol-1-phosphate synthase